MEVRQSEAAAPPPEQPRRVCKVRVAAVVAARVAARGQPSDPMPAVVAEREGQRFGDLIGVAGRSLSGGAARRERSRKGENLAGQHLCLNRLKLEGISRRRQLLAKGADMFSERSEEPLAHAWRSDSLPQLCPDELERLVTVFLSARNLAFRPVRSVPPTQNPRFKPTDPMWQKSNSALGV